MPGSLQSGGAAATRNGTLRRSERTHVRALGRLGGAHSRSGRGARSARRPDSADAADSGADVSAPRRCDVGGAGEAVRNVMLRLTAAVPTSPAHPAISIPMRSRRHQGCRSGFSWWEGDSRRTRCCASRQLACERFHHTSSPTARMSASVAVLDDARRACGSRRPSARLPGDPRNAC